MITKQHLKKTVLIGAVVMMLIGVIAAVWIGIWVVNATPDISYYGSWKPTTATRIYAANGEVLQKLYKEKRIYVSLDKIPKELQHAVIATEDARFRQHIGIDPRAILRAAWVDLKHWAKVQGASTITQQLARNALLTNKKLFSRKLKEMYLAFQFERMYTKDQILEFYLNEIFMGHGIYGVQSAAKFYFNKDVEKLTLSQCALLVGLIRAPNYYSPYRNRKAARQRRNIVLYNMVQQGYISTERANRAQQTPIKLEHPPQEGEQLAPYFIRYVRKKVINKFGAERVYTAGLEIHTTLSPELQTKAKSVINGAIKSGYIPTVKKQVGYGQQQPQVALVTMDPETGYIKAMIGGRGNDKFNRATQAYRQVGSAFKPFVYTEALQQGMSPGTVIDNSLKKYKRTLKGDKYWVPQNYNDKYLGPTTLRIGLARSINVMAVKLLDKVGVGNVIQLTKKLGVDSLVPEDRHLAIALGGLTKGITLLDMVQSYGVFANQGIKVSPIAITKVYDSQGHLLWNNKKRNKQKKQIVLSKGVSYLITDMLQSVVARGPLVWGTGWRAKLNRPAAGKTGTTSNYTDGWFIGYTPGLVTGIWLGEDRPSRMEYKKYNQAGEVIKNKKGEPVTRIISSAEASKLWGDYMSRAVKNRPIKHFSQPDKIVTQAICVESGKLPNQYCRQENTVRRELFLKGHLPTESCFLHKKMTTVKVDTSTYKLATPYCPDSVVETKRYQEATNILVDERGVPIKQHKQFKGVALPARDKKGNFVYKKIPTEKCDRHLPRNLLKHKILNIFGEGSEGIFY